jgi:hypothetical protein
MSRPPSESTSARKARQTNEAAWKIIDAEKAKQDAKTARLKAQREAAETSAPPADETPRKGKAIKRNSRAST